MTMVIDNNFGTILRRFTQDVAAQSTSSALKLVIKRLKVLIIRRPRSVFIKAFLPKTKQNGMI